MDRDDLEDDSKDAPEDLDTMARDGLTSMKINGYAVSHFNNDLCASIYFIYMTWYLINVVHLSKSNAALCLLSGQIADALTTPTVGVLSDSITTKCGKRMLWYIMGSLIVFPTYAAIFVYPGFINTEEA